MSVNRSQITGWQELRQLAQHDDLPLGDTQIVVSIDQQVLWLVDHQHTQYYKVSTSRFGTGQQTGSFQTPLGLHRIVEKVGADVPALGILKSRCFTGECAVADQQTDEDVITSRILWLQGLQPGFNAGGEVDSKQRYIYIHGTADEAHIGQPASIGCIRMLNQDVISLFDNVQQGTLVYIHQA